MKRRKAIDPTDPLRDLDKAIRCLKIDQGAASRRNARANVAAEIRRLRQWIDKTFKPIRKKKKRRARKPGAIWNDLYRAGWRANFSPSEALMLANLGVKGRLVGVSGSLLRMFPPWVVSAAKQAHTLKELRQIISRAKRSKHEQNAIIVRQGLLDTVTKQNAIIVS